MTSESVRPKLAFYWAASCGGCEITITELGMQLAVVGELVDIVFWPCLMDFKYSDIEALADSEIDVCFFNGGIRNSENEHIAKLLRRKSKLMVAFGACAHEGGIPGLANLYDPESILERVYDTSPSLDGSAGTRPDPLTRVPEGEIVLPTFYDRVKTLAQTVEVDYYMPGCPPVVDQVGTVFEALLEGKIPEPGAIIGADGKTNCDVCARQKASTGTRVQAFTRPHLIEADPDTCFLVQGLICCGPATRSGCGLPCIEANMPCRGCYGPPAGVRDQGAKLLSAIGAIIDADTPEDTERIMHTIVDPVGTYYRFNLSDSILSELKYGQQRRIADEEDKH